MQALHDLLDRFEVLGTAAAIAVGMIVLLWLYIPPIRLVWRCLSFEERFPIWNTLRACFVCAWPFKPAVFRNQMRLWLELRLLNPEPPKTPKWYFDHRSKRYQLMFDRRMYRRGFSVWRRETQGKFAALKVREKEPVIEVRDVFRLNDESTKNGIKQYLLAVSDLKLSLDEQASFLCKVRINEGFLLPLNLLAGLMSRFSDDWDPIISSYGHLATKAYSPAQMSLFNLWLLWGPSVSVCTCDQWSGPVTLQYGFGDENNSVRVRLEGVAKQRVLDELKRSVERRGVTAYPALHASIVGKLWPPSSFVQGQFCAAQNELLNPDREAFILEYDSHAVIGNAAGSNLFYTAYVWVAFVVGRGTKPSIEEVRSEPWRRVLTFFEHANIVDEVAYEMAKQNLARKVLAYLKTAEKDEPGQAPLSLWYVGALDESGCGQPLEVPVKGSTIWNVIEQTLKEAEFRQIRGRIGQDDSFAEVLSGCHLSDAVNDFLDDVDRQSRGKRPKRKTGRRQLS